MKNTNILVGYTKKVAVFSLVLAIGVLGFTSSASANWGSHDGYGNIGFAGYDSSFGAGSTGWSSGGSFDSFGGGFGNSFGSVGTAGWHSPANGSFYDPGIASAFGNDGMLFTGDETWGQGLGVSEGFYHDPSFSTAFGQDGLLFTGDEYGWGEGLGPADGFYHDPNLSAAFGDDGLLFTGDETWGQGLGPADGFYHDPNLSAAFGDDGLLFTGDETWGQGLGPADGFYQWGTVANGYGTPSADGGYFPIQNSGGVTTLSNNGGCSGGVCGLSDGGDNIVNERGTCRGCGLQAGSDDCLNCGSRPSTVHSAQRPVYVASRGGSGLGVVSDLLDLGLSYSSAKSDNDTNIDVDSHDRTNYTVKNTDNSDRSVRTTVKYEDNSVVDNSIRIDSDNDTTITYNYDGDGGGSSSNGSLRLVCRVSDTFIDEGDTVRFEADVRGGDSPYDYDWRGDIDGDDRVERVRFNRDGRYQVSVRVEDDDGRVVTDRCPDIIVGDDNGGVNIISGTGAPTGNLASLNSVFLSQVPYTGARDTLMVVAYAAAILVWSAIIVFFIARRKKRNKIANRIQEFKNQNREAELIA